MGLKELKLPEIQIAGGAFAVRGLGLNDITVLVNKHEAKLEAIFRQAFEAATSGEDPETVAGMAMTMLQSIPDLVVDVIAMAADATPEDAEKLGRIPIEWQYEAVQAIGQLTFGADGGVKKALGAVLPILQGKNAALTQSAPGSGGSAGK